MKKKSFLLLSPVMISVILLLTSYDMQPGDTGPGAASDKPFFQEQIYPVVIAREHLVELLNNTPERKAIRLKLKKNANDEWLLKAWGATEKGGKEGGPKLLAKHGSGNTEAYVPSYDRNHKHQYITRGEIRHALGIAPGSGAIDPALIVDGIILTPCRKDGVLRYYISKLSKGPRNCSTLALADPGTTNPSPPGFDCGTHCDDPDFN